MRNLIRALALLPALTLTACGGGDGGDSETLSTLGPASANAAQEVLLGYGETADVGRLSLEFTAVEDSRCGANSSAVCAWEGNASIIVSVTNGQISQLLTLNSNSKFPTSAVFAGRVIELRRLDPQPRFTVPPGLDEYTATLVVHGD